MRQRSYVYFLIWSLLAAGANLFFLVRDWRTETLPGLSIVAILISIASAWYSIVMIRKLDPVRQLQSRLNPKKLERSITVFIYDRLLAKTVQIDITHYPGVITEGNIHVRVNEDQRIDIYEDGVLSLQFYAEQIIFSK